MDVLIPPNNVTEFILLGLTQNPLLQKILFIVFLFIFLVTVLANLLIVITISLSPTLSAPMYFFLTYLAFIDASYTSVTTSKLITDLLYQRRTISLGGCLTQLFLEHFLGGSEIILLISSKQVRLFYNPCYRPEREYWVGNSNMKMEEQVQKEIRWLMNNPWFLVCTLTLWISRHHRIWRSEQSFCEVDRADILLQMKTLRLKDKSHLPRATQIEINIIGTVNSGA